MTKMMLMMMVMTTTTSACNDDIFCVVFWRVFTRCSAVLVLSYTASNDVTATVAKTESIFLPVCMDLWYTQTCYPNALGHQSQHAASEAGLSFLALFSSSCSEYMIRFWCMLFVPDCSTPDRPISPCRSFCQSRLYDNDFF